MADNVHIFGIRHHGPGSARSVLRALKALQPDVVLVEGPPDAEAMLALLPHAEMRPPVALLIYQPDRPSDAVYYPFAEFSPEWQALRYGLERGIPVRFMDLPQAHRMALQAHELEAAPGDPAGEAMEDEAKEDEAMASESGEATTPGEETSDPDPASLSPEECHRLLLRRDPLGCLAKAAGYSDGERWWEHMVEQRRDTSDLFAGILEVMSALRDAAGTLPLAGATADLDCEILREAWMRRTIRAAQADGFERIAVVCGAWHAPALARMPPAREDAALLKGLPKVKVRATWVPWTYGRLALESGYGAGIESPGWYDHLWRWPDDVTVRWMTRVAHLFREKDLDASSAHVIEGVRLAETLAALRDRPLPGLPEMNEAIRTVFCFGDDTPMRLIERELIIGEQLGAVPEETPSVPLQQDLQRLQKRLRLPVQADFRDLKLDLRQPTDLERSQLLHRLSLLRIPWGSVRDIHGARGTFREEWRIQWLPELSVRVIESAVWGNTVAAAATAYALHLAEEAADLPALTAIIDHALLADLPDALGRLMACLEERAALTSDVTHLMGALPKMAYVLRYPNVRQTDRGMLARVVDGLVARVCIGLPGACASLNDDAAGAMFTRLVDVDGAIKLLESPEYGTAWSDVLARLADQHGLHGLVAGRACRLLLDTGVFSPDEAARRMGLALSTAAEPAQAAAWVEGFLRDSGLLLLHDEALWQVVDSWVTGLSSEIFPALLPLLRRTFSTFSRPERRQMGERVRQGAAARPGSLLAADPEAFDQERADRALGLVAQLLGLSAPEAVDAR